MSYHDKNIPSGSSQSKTNSQGQIAPEGYHYMPDGTLMADKDHADMLTTGSPPVIPSMPAVNIMVHKWVKCDKKLPAGIFSTSSLVGDELEIQLEDESPIPQLPNPQYQGHIHRRNTFYNHVGQPSVGDVVRVEGHRFHGFQTISCHICHGNFIPFNFSMFN